jgi:hypothetical protein
MHHQTPITERVSQFILATISKLTPSGLSPKDISSVIGLGTTAVHQIIARDPKHRARELQQLQTLDLQAQQLHDNTLPAFIYSYKFNTDQLYRTSLVTGELSSHRVPSYQFKKGCCCSEVPGGSLLITGGGFPATMEAVRIDTLREFAVAQHPPMLIARCWHAAVNHTPHLYLLGGSDGSRFLRECERYVCAERRWEALPPLPRACSNTSGVVVESSLYALGGDDGALLDLVQRMSLVSFTWELMQVRLPHAFNAIACFKLRDIEVYLVVKKTLCSLTSLQVLPLKNLPQISNAWCGASYNRRGTLYCSSFEGAVRSSQIGSLSN